MAEKYESFGKYILLEKLATGGMAEVYLSKAPSAGGISKFVAIKRILPQFSESPEFIDMFKDEAKIAINLNHSNIVSIYEFGVERKQFFLVMDYVEGRNLRQILNKLKKTTQQLTTEQILYIVKEVASGLDNAHRCLDGSTGRPLNITHRDMSPQNIMISFEGETKIVDFGIAKAESQLETTRAGTLKGKFGYMSPEQAEGLTVDLRTDIFSLGIVLWELLANDRLFVANNEINTLRKIRDCQIPSLRKINPNIPQELDRIVNKALARDRNLRYQTAAAFQKDLNKFLNRQFPDFSPHDFSVFVKTLFANEILENRKRLIEYAKVPFKDSYEGDTNTEEITTTQTDTGASPRPPGRSRLSQKRVQAPSNFNAEPAAKVTFDNLQVSRKEMMRKSLELKQTNQTPLVSDPEPQSQPSIALSSPSMTSPTNTGLTPPPNIGNTSPTGIGITSPTNPDISAGTRSNYSSVTDIKKINGGGGILPKALLFLTACFAGIYFFKPQLLNEFIDLSSSGASNQAPQAQANNSDQANQYASDEDSNTFRLMVVSKPDEAQIFVDGKDTGKVTPATVDVPQNTPIDIDLKKVGYLTWGRRYSVPQNGGKIQANLEKEIIGFLDVSVSPQNSRVIIYIDDEKLPQGPPIKGFRVQAGKRINIKAINPFTRQKAEQLVFVDKDQTKKVSLKFRKLRKPSGMTRAQPRRK